MSYGLAMITARHEGTLPQHLGMEWTRAERGLVEGRFVIEKRHLAGNGFLHAATLVALMDSACGYGAMLSLPDGAESFTTIELKSNFLGTAREGEVTCRAVMVHGGRATQVWDAEARSSVTGKTLALFRCTQMVLWPRAA
ncbi:PaaI family thioesterase [Camelimonas abortus]|uniref:PaaI family thioesterase n=1 Tax=Camelimonas abortus TaxID=1017184 RepID=A0ABV7LBL7_9HYPH